MSRVNPDFKITLVNHNGAIIPAVTFKGKSIPVINYPFKTAMVAADAYSPRAIDFASTEGGNFLHKKANAFTKATGYSPKYVKKTFNALARQKLEVDFGQDFMRYGFTMGGRVSSSNLEAMYRSKAVMDAYKKDGLDNLIPFAFRFKKTPKELKELFGKGLWKRLCANSMTRNKYIANYCKYMSDSTLKNMVRTLSYFPSAILKRGYKYLHFEGEVALLLRDGYTASFIASPEGIRMIHMLNDTGRMAARRGVEFNPEWSVKRILALHEELTALQNAEAQERLYNRHKNTVAETNALEEAQTKASIYQSEGVTCVLLDTPTKLLKEAKDMKHCLAAYASRVLSGKYLAYSVTAVDGTRSTLGLRVDFKNDKVQVVFNQHYGYCNEIIKDIQVQSVVDTFVERLNNTLDIKVTKEGSPPSAVLRENPLFGCEVLA